ncbi:MAG: hypothetical protein AAFV88_21245 [Planctomycetota bacterium]
MTRRLFRFMFAAAIFASGMVFTRQADAQSEAILAEVYGRGVHAYYAGRYDEAYSLLSSAIGGGTKDPRAYYFRGIVSNARGSVYEAEADWAQGAQLEAQAGDAIAIGRSLSRFQGSARLKLEGIRQQARLTAMTTAKSRSDQRLRELGVAPGASAVPGAAAPANSAPPAVATPAPAPPAMADPFADGTGMAAGQPSVQSDNALDGLDGNPFKDDPVAGGDANAAATMDAAPAGDNGPFGTPAGNDDPFGSPAGGNDPFGGSSGGAGADDPFADDPFK